jgi:hypothetical protein
MRRWLVVTSLSLAAGCVLAELANATARLRADREPTARRNLRDERRTL